ncbi:hypothetical protein [Moorena sp. SIO2C4]|nr:hypothetical protein [Moorena sp. SIO2C4]NEQ14212.1 hypothetical protein [Moorena sp. SIO3E2]NES41559.1 hypothetical protein [Moorena sp. SIO2C4]
MVHGYSLAKSLVRCSKRAATRSHFVAFVGWALPASNPQSFQSIPILE